MGVATPSKPISTQYLTMLQQYDILRQQADIGTLLKHKQTARQYLLRQLTHSDEKQHLVQLQILKKNKQLLQIEKIISFKQQQLCSNSFKIYVLVQWQTRTLQDQIVARNQLVLKFSQREIWDMLTSTISTLSFMQKHALKHETISSKNIKYTRTGCRLFYPQILNISTNYQALSSKRSTKHVYVSPQLLHALQEEMSFPYCNAYKSDVWTLGMVVLETALSEYQDQCYKDQYSRIHEETLQFNLSRFKHIFSSQLYEIVQLMLSKQERKRPDWFELEQKINKKLIHPYRLSSLSDRAKILHSPNALNSSINPRDIQTSITMPLFIDPMRYSTQPRASFEQNNIPLGYSSKPQPMIASVPAQGQANAQKFPLKSKQKIHLHSQLNSQSYSMKPKQVPTAGQIQTPNNYLITNRPSISNAQYQSQPASLANEGQRPASFTGTQNNFTFRSNFASIPLPSPQRIVSNNLRPLFDKNRQIHFVHSTTQQQKQGQTIPKEAVGGFSPDRAFASITARPVSQANQVAGQAPIKHHVLNNQNRPRKNIFPTNVYNTKTKVDQNLININDEYSQISQGPSLNGNFLFDTHHKYLIQPQSANNIRNEPQSAGIYKNPFTPSSPTDPLRQKIRVSSHPQPYQTNSFSGSPTQNIGPTSNLDNNQRQEQSDYVIQKYKQGSQYKGYKWKGMRHGHGVFYYQDGGMYQGEWRQNKMQGQGRLFYQSGKLAYDGSWLRDQFSGKGTLYNQQPDMLTNPFNYKSLEQIDEYWTKYEGEFVEDLKNGFGVLYLSNGQIFSGIFVNDIAQGQGSFIRKNGQKVTGRWHRNRYVQ